MMGQTIGRNTEFGPRVNAEHIQRSKLRIETRLKLLAKWNPKKYGDKLALEGEIGIRTVLVPKPVKDTAPRPATTPDFEA